MFVEYSSRKRKASDDTPPVDELETADNNSIVANEIAPVKGDKVKLRFQLAEDHKVPGLDHIDVTFEGGQIRALWKNFHSRKANQETEISHEEMETFHSELRSHVKNITKLRLDDRSIFILSQVFLLQLFPLG